MPICPKSQRSSLVTLLQGAILAGALFLASCGGGGGGGGGDDFIGAALVSLQVSPDRIDTGDRLMVRTEISQAHDNGIVLKFRVPEGLSYVLNSAELTVEGDEGDASPDVNTTSENKRFLVFFLSRSNFDDDGQGTLTFQLEGNDEISDGLIEVDADVDDPLVSNASEFNVEQPEFGAEDEANVEVVD